ncbi:MAG: chromosome segregation protein SMC [Chloroflexi bacterium]|nr:chromosome segregation protein SMC [Chloroflexota bacterium]
MRLKSLELHGYKTFASRTTFEFADMITAIVGPNGSGKSNIADSLRWVLGEQSYTLLRGKKTEDMIFSGSEQRSRAGMASATVTFDNNDGWLPIEYGEVAVTRRAYRDGQNEYLINGQRVRLKDVSELLAQSGLAERTYTIIGQGVVDAALSLKAEERRRLFEEAAGIGLHRARREEALRRLEATRRNLERAEDILAELQPRLKGLERQARRAQEYEQVRADLRVLLLEWYGYHWHNAQRDYSDARKHAAQQETALGLIRAKQETLDGQMADLRLRTQGVRARLTAWLRENANLNSRREELSRNNAVAQERSRSLEEQRRGLTGEIAPLEEELALIEERLAAAAAEAVALDAEWVETRSQAEAARLALQSRQTERAGMEQRLRQAQERLSSFSAHRGQMQVRMAEGKGRGERDLRAIEGLSADAAAAQQEMAAFKDRLIAAAIEVKEAEGALAAGEQALGAERKRIVEAEEKRKKLLEERTEMQGQLGRIQAQIDVLAQAESALVGYASGARAVLSQAGRAGLAARGALSSFLEVSPEHEKAIAAALGEFLDAVVLPDERNADAALDILSKEALRGALLPLDFLAPMAALRPPKEEGILGLAADLIAAPAELRPALDLLLGHTLVVQDRRTARRIIAAAAGKDGEARRGLRLVTLEGEVFHASGPIVAGKERDQSALSRPRQRKTLQGELDAAQKRLHEINLRLTDSQVALAELGVAESAAQEQADKLRKALESARNAHRQLSGEIHQREAKERLIHEQKQRLSLELERSRDETKKLEVELAGLGEQIQAARLETQRCGEELAALGLEEIQERALQWETLAAVNKKAREEAASRCQERTNALERARRQLAEKNKRLGELEQAIQDLGRETAQQRQDEAELSAQAEALNALIQPAEKELAELDAAQEALEQEHSRFRQTMSAGEHHHAQAKIALVRQQEALESWKRRIEEDFGLVAFEYVEDITGATPLPMEGMVQQLPRVLNISAELEENVRRMRTQLRRMGAINPEAQAEYQEVKERFEFMTTQIADLKQAEEDIREVIAELDTLMQRELRRTFDAVAGEFSAIFNRLFGGGSAKLALTDPEDMTNTGIEIEARLPGRRMQGLSLLSGGERSLTATALIFSLLKVSPTPFCLLDEVDAMLDEANVTRLRDLLVEFSQKTQFILVTHNRNTVQAAGVIYGVTMGRDSASQVISLRLDQVEEVVES